MELPTYRLPTLRNVIYHMWDKTQHYLRKIGTIILIGVVIVWALEYFPRKTINSSSLNQQKEIIQTNTTNSESERNKRIVEIESEIESDRLVNSYLGQLGKMIEPVMRPLGFRLENEYFIACRPASQRNNYKYYGSFVSKW